MLGPLKNRFEKLGFAANVLSSTGMLSALSARGLVSFARAARGIKPSPYAAVMLHAANKPEKVALVEGKRRLRYDQFDEEINQLAEALAVLGVRRGQGVALMMPNCIEYIVAQQALGRMGATAVQIGSRLKGPEIAYILENAEPRAVIVHRDHLAEMSRARKIAGLPGDSQVLVVAGKPGDAYLSYADAIGRQDGSQMPAPGEGEGGGGVLIYTSGTTGKPKGASRDMNKTGLEAAADFMRKIGMRHDDVHLVVCPLYHSAAPAFASLMLSLGATAVVQERFDAEQVLATIARERVSCAFVVPTMLVRLAALDEEIRCKYDTSSLRWVCSGAAPLAHNTARRFQERFGYLLWNFYGATETGLVTLAGPDDHADHPGTVGRLLRGNEVRLLDNDGNDVPVGEVGELYTRNEMLITGYHKDSEATKDAMNGGFFSVGDLARVDHDGFYYLESRKHDMVISGGVNIYPREVEEHLHTHPDILEAAVIGVPDEDWGESLKAFVVSREGSDLTELEVMNHCKDALAGYKCPRHIAFLDALPHNPTGKVLKRELRAHRDRR